jgi:hypothetical protein
MIKELNFRSYYGYSIDTHLSCSVLGLVAIALTLNHPVASQASSLERSSLSQRKELQPNELSRDIRRV